MVRDLPSPTFRDEQWLTWHLQRTHMTCKCPIFIMDDGSLFSPVQCGPPPFPPNQHGRQFISQVRDLSWPPPSRYQVLAPILLVVSRDMGHTSRMLVDEASLQHRQTQRSFSEPWKSRCKHSFSTQASSANTSSATTVSPTTRSISNAITARTKRRVRGIQ